MTGYIDFLTVNELTSPVMRGIDIYNRPFFTICADIVYENGIHVPTFTTMFKRYSDNSMLWQCAGCYRQLVCTDGGMNIPQLGLFRNLIQNGEVHFDDGTDDQNIQNLRLMNYVVNSDGIISTVYEFVRPVKIELSLRNPEEYYGYRSVILI